MRKFRILTFIIPALALASCETGSGPESIPGTPATPLPPVEIGFCDPINFELVCGVPPLTNFASGVTVVIDNPDMSGINTSERVAQMQKFFNPVELFGGTRLDLASPITFDGADTFQAFTMKVWSSRPVAVLLKAEENTDGSGGIGRPKGHTGSGTWEELCYEFAGADLANDVLGITVIFDNGVTGAAGLDPDNWTFFYDDITRVENCPPGPPTELPVDFENEPFGYNFGPDGGFEGAFTSVITNPDQSGINTSLQVARTLKFPVDNPANTFGGSNLNLDVTTEIESGSSFTMKVWSQRQVPVLVEPFPQGSGSGAEVIHTGTGWELLTFPLPDTTTGTVEGVVVIFDRTEMGDAQNNPADWTFYYDDITLLPPGSGPAAGGQVPGTVIVAADGSAPDLAATFTPFSSGSVIVPDFGGDSSYANVVEVSVGAGYGGGALAQAGITGFTAGFAATFDVFAFKVKGLDADNTIVVKLEDDGGAGALVQIDLNAPPAGVTVDDLGDGWSQVVMQMSLFGDVSGSTRIVFETLPGAYAEDDRIYLTDIGFSTTVAASTDPVVFDDDYGAGVTFVPFDGSVNDLNVDATEAYSGTSSLRVAVPAAGYTGGALVVDPGRDVSGYDRLTFWAKADGAFTLNVAGVGNDGVDTTNQTEVTNLALTTDWQQFTIMISDPSVLTANRGLFHFAEGSDEGAYTIWIDDITYATAAPVASTDPVVFDDDYGMGVSFVAFDGSVNDLSVDATEAYSGTSSLRAAVPAAGYTGGALVVDPGRNVSGYDVLTFWAKADGAFTLNVAGVGNDGVDTTNQTEVTNLALTTDWQQFTITISDPSVLTANTGLFHFAEGSDEGAYTIWFDDITYATSGGGGSVGGQAINGDFEDVAFDNTPGAVVIPGWEVFENNGTIEVSTDAYNGSYSAHLVAARVQNPLIKQFELEAGTVQPGDPIDIEFWMKGTAGAGGVIFPELFSEGDPTTNEILETIAVPNADWTRYAYSTTAGADVTRGVTLQIAAVCGDVMGCFVDIFVDDVVITIGGGN